jgi:signal transduction histidine kinase/CheY-like chemotaxis protein
MVASFLLRKYDAETAEVFDELIQESLRILLPVTAMLTWGWTAFVLLFAKSHFVHAFAVLVLTLGTAWVSYRLSQKHLRLAVGLYISNLTAAATIIALAFQNPATLYLYMQVVLITAMLTNPPVTWGVALASAGLAFAIGRDGRTTQLVDVALPIIFILLTALASWLSSRRLLTALAWALSMTGEAQKNAEEARRHRAEVQRVLKSLDEAYVRLERTNEALIFAQEAAERAYRFKAEFVANVSHELRTPLNLIVGFSEMMATAPESYGGVPLPSEYRGDVTATYRSARHLSDLIDDVLDLSRIEAGRMPLIKEATDLGQVVREATEMVRGLAQARGLRLELDMPGDLPELPLDRTRIRQVLLNLLTNATRFTDEGGIRVQIRVRGQEAVVTVQDSGRGIAPDRLASAFEAFSQLDDGQAREGSGLGLAVSRRFVELHGGRMWVESEMGRGTTVGFALPIPAADGEVHLSQLTASAASRSHEEEPLVLVLHDDPRVLSLLRRYVDGYQFRLAENVDQAREIIHEAFPIAVVADTTRAGRAAAGAPDLDLPSHMPLITCPLPSMRRLGLLLGAADYLPKPVTREDLSNALSRLPEPPQTVLVVDDNPHVVRLLARMLKAGNPSLRVLEAFGGREGLEVARSERPDVVLLDLVMPEMNGYVLLEELANDEAMARTQVVIVSVRSVEEESVPIVGELRLEREAGFSLTEILQMLRAALSAITRPLAMAPPSAAALPEAQPA